MKVLRVIALVGVLLMLSSKQRNDTQRRHTQRTYNDLDDNQRVEMYFLTED